MRMLRPAGYPANRTAGRWVFDMLVTLVAAAAAGPSSIHDHPHPQVAAIVVLALAAVPLLFRRIWPVPVFGVVLAVNAGAVLWDGAQQVNGPALLIALYPVAAMRPAPGRPGVRRPARARHDRRGDLGQGRRLVVSRDLPVRAGRGRPRARPVLRHAARLPRRTARPR